MNQHLQNILNLIEQAEHLSEEQKSAAIKSLKEADKEFEITAFKLDRTDKVKRTTAILLEETIEELEQKRKSVEAQNRELEIEAALERVRTVAMSMNKASDLLLVCKAVYSELLLLGFKDLRNALIHTYHDEEKQFDDYDYSDFTNGHISRIPYTGNSIIENFINDIRSSKNAFTEVGIAGKDLIMWRSFRDANNEAPDDRLAGADALYYYFYSIEGASLGISTFSSISEAQQEILKRFRNVFDLAYKRYVDISNAEAQAKEAQIQLALERVRARTMAMQHSDELRGAATLLFNQVQAMGMPAFAAGYCTWDNEKKDSITLWMSSEGVLQPPFKAPTTEDELFIQMRKGFEEGKKLHVVEMGGDDLVEHYRYMRTLPIVGDIFDALLEAGHVLPAYQVMHQAYFSDGFLLFITYQPVPDAHDIFTRFGNVFEQTYTRFLDLKKAEAQAREAQVQLALERVRARTMAMQHSEELAEAAAVLFEQAKYLGIEAYTSGFNIWDEANEKLISWMANPSGVINPAFVFPAREYEQYDRFYKAWKNKIVFLEEDLVGDALKAHYDYLRSFPLLNEAFTKAEKAGIPTPTRQVLNIVFFTHGYLLFISLEPQPAFHDLFKRFGRVFQQTYTRFLDLQKSEDQTREAQIEAALERVRSKAMSMQKSDDLSDAVAVVFEEMDKLNLGMLRCGIGILDREKRTADVFSTTISEGDKVVQVYGDESMDIHPLLKGAFDTWLQGIDHDYVLEGDDLVDYYKAVSKTNFHLPRSQQIFDKNQRQYYFRATFNEGGLFAFRDEPFPEEAKQVMKRFAAVFDLTYKRFLDLLKAEAQAREARIQLALERVRARTMAMHKSDELPETSHILFEQMKELGEPVEQLTIGIVDEESNSIEISATLMGDTLKKVYRHSVDEPYMMKKIYNGWKNRAQTLEVELKGDELNAYNRYRNELTNSQMFPTNLGKEHRRIVYAAYFSKGMLALGSNEPRPPSSVQLLQRFASVFDLTYTRFLDLQKAEAQAREAQIESALEKVRSRTLAMQKSDELAETAAVLFQQLIILGIAPNRLYISTIKNDQGDAEFWITDEDGTKVSTAFHTNLRGNKSFQKMFNGWQQQQKSIVIDMQGEELEEYFRHLTSLGVPFKDGLTQKRRIQEIAYFSKGFIGMASPDEQPAETLQLLERFAAVFNLTFTRFNDLKLAEAHAAQAEQDLIAIKEAKQKAEAALTELQATQRQLIQSEKMASLGELTAGIAHEIQNPLNFVNNFSEVSKELLHEMKEAMENGDTQDVKEIMNDVIQNLEKINHHGRRADGIVKGMLQHSRSSTGQKESTDINALCDEYMRLAYHGLRAKDKSFNAKFETDFDNNAGNLDVVPQEIGRVILNLINNAFYAVSEKARMDGAGYQPTVVVSTKKQHEKVEISVRDNGNGIPASIKEKIFQPFFTTKPTGSGTGLGLSLSYDIVKAHAGTIQLSAVENEGTVFSIILPS